MYEPIEACNKKIIWYFQGKLCHNHSRNIYAQMLKLEHRYACEPLKTIIDMFVQFQVHKLKMYIYIFFNLLKNM